MKYPCLILNFEDTIPTISWVGGRYYVDGSSLSAFNNGQKRLNLFSKEIQGMEIQEVSAGFLTRAFLWNGFQD